jgi:hypothetical protein
MGAKRIFLARESKRVEEPESEFVKTESQYTLPPVVVPKRVQGRSEELLSVRDRFFKK